jgi:predicted DNA-binding transcriptional regulator YafY
MSEPPKLATVEFPTHISFHEIPCSSPNLLLFQTISDALNQRRELKLSYRKLTAQRFERRHVRPYHLACIHRQWYLFAFDRMRQDIRRFVLSRMKKVTLTETTFTIPPDFNVADLLSGSFGVHSPTGDYHIIIRFNGLAAQLVRERQWHPTQKIIPLPNNAIELHLHLTSLEEIERWILGWGPDARVLEPSELRNRIVNKIEEMAAKDV